MNLGNGRKVVAAAGTALALSATNVPVKKLIITPLHTNMGSVSVGSSTTLATAGSESGWIAVKDANPLILEDIDLKQVYVDATVNGEGVSYTYEF